MRTSQLGLFAYCCIRYSSIRFLVVGTGVETGGFAVDGERENSSFFFLLRETDFCYDSTTRRAVGGEVFRELVRESHFLFFWSALVLGIPNCP